MNAMTIVRRPVAIQTREHIGDAMDAFVALKGEAALARLMNPAPKAKPKRIEPKRVQGVMEKRGAVDLAALDDASKHSATRVAMIAKHGATISEISETTGLSKSSVTHWAKRLVEAGAVAVVEEVVNNCKVYVIMAQYGGVELAAQMTCKEGRQKKSGLIRTVSRGPAYRGILNALSQCKGAMRRRGLVQATGLPETQLDYCTKYLRMIGLVERTDGAYSLTKDGREIAKKACAVAPPRQRVRAAVLKAERTTGAIADKADVDRNTARRALLEMVDEGKVSMRIEQMSQRKRIWWKLTEGEA